MIIKPITLIDQVLDWPHGNGDRYRFVARPTEYGFNGVDYQIEQFSGTDAMGAERWEPVEETSYSMAIAAIGQQLLIRILGSKIAYSGDD